MSGYTLYGADVSYYTGKARAYLRWRGVPFGEVTATQEIYQTVILPEVGWPVIPVLKSPDGEVIQDTADIIDFVEAHEQKHPSVLPEGSLQRFIAALIHLYADEWLVIPAMHYRWNFNEDWTYGEFGRMSAPHLTPEEQYQIGAKNGQRFRGALPVLGVSPATIPGIEASYEALLDELSAHFAMHDYLLGGRPTLADFAMIGPMYAHLWRDPVSRDLMETRAPRVAAWVHRVHEGQGRGGSVLPDDAIPETLLPVLARQFREQFPALQATLKLFSGWVAQAAPQAFVPRSLGELQISIEGHTGPAQARTFPLYRLQAAKDAYDQLSGPARVAADHILNHPGGELFADLDLAARLTRRTNRLALA